MSGLYKTYFKPVLLIGDLLVLNACFWCIYTILMPATPEFYPAYLIYIVSFNLLFLLNAFLNEIYHIPRRQKKRTPILNLLKALLLSILIIELSISLMGYHEFPRSFFLWFYGSLLFLLGGWRYLVLISLRYYRLSGYNYRKIVIAGYTREAIDLANYFDHHPEFGYRFFGFFDNDIDNPHVKGGMNSLINYVQSEDIDEIYCCATKCDNDLTTKLMALREDVKVQWIPEMDFANRNMRMEFVGGVPVLSQPKLPANNIVMRFVKRSFDIVFSLFVIVFILSWLLPVLAILIKLDSRGNVFFKQKRTGLNNKPFLCYKLRTMKPENQYNRQRQAKKDDERITRVGRILRRTNLDEIPQFFNVLLGHMSIVGPRPHMVEHTHHYSRLIDQFMVRHIVKPGITGLSQVKGFRGETSNPILMKSRIKEDIYYMFNWSFLLDLKIILLTVLNMIKGEENAY